MQPVQQPVDQSSLAGAYFSSERDESLARLYAVHQTGERFLDLLGQKQKPRIRIDVKRIFLQSEKALVHSDLVVSFDPSLSFSPSVLSRAAPMAAYASSRQVKSDWW